jgi:hypothetical protein
MRFNIAIPRTSLLLPIIGAAVVRAVAAAVATPVRVGLQPLALARGNGSL